VDLHLALRGPFLLSLSLSLSRRLGNTRSLCLRLWPPASSTPQPPPNRPGAATHVSSGHRASRPSLTIYLLCSFVFESVSSIFLRHGLCCLLPTTKSVGGPLPGYRRPSVMAQKHLDTARLPSATHDWGVTHPMPGMVPLLSDERGETTNLNRTRPGPNLYRSFLPSRWPRASGILPPTRLL
jgi:hypothetical protein